MYSVYGVIAHTLGPHWTIDLLTILNENSPLQGNVVQAYIYIGHKLYSTTQF